MMPSSRLHHPVNAHFENGLFFFQAEDGIRDVAVTGVQTCALPISPARADVFVDRLPVGGDDSLESAGALGGIVTTGRSEEHTSELQSRLHLVCRLLLEKKKKHIKV